MPEKRDQGRQMYDAIALRCTHKHTCARSPRSGLAVRAPQLPPALQRALGCNGGSSQPSSPGKQQPESPLFPRGKSQLVKAALPAAKGNFQKMQDTGVPKFSGAAVMLLHRPGNRRAPAAPGSRCDPRPARRWVVLLACCFFFFLRGGLYSLQQPRQEPPRCCGQANPGPGFRSGQGPAAAAHHRGVTHGGPGFSPGAAPVLHPPPS